MDFTIEEYNEVVHLTIIEETDTLEFSIEETVEELNLVIEEYHGADGAKGEKPNHQWNGTSLRFENPDDTWGNYVDLKGDKGEDGGGLMSVVAGDNITIDNTDPLNPIINAEDGGTTVTKTSDLINDGADGVNPYISLNDIPEVDISTKAEKDGSNITDTITWRAALDVYNKSEVNSKFINNTSESLTSIEQPTLVGNVLTLKYVGENGIIQEETVDLSNLATIDIHIEDASYNASTNVLTITDTEGVEYNVDLSEFSILTSTNASGITTLTQEGVNKLIVSKVGQTGKFPDLLNKPTTLSGYGITDAMSTSHAANIITSTNINNWNTAFGWGNHATAGYLSAVDLNNYVTLNTAQTITGLKNFSNGFDINTFKYRAFDSTNTVTIGKNVFGTSSNIDNAAIAMGNSIFPNMNLQPYTPDQAGANRGYLGIGSEIFIDYTGATNYRPSHNVHDSWIGIGRFIGKGFLDGTNVTLLGTSILHKNDISYADSLTIVGKGFSNGIKTRANKILDPNRVVTAKNGFNVRNMMYNVVGMGNENWVEDITQSVVIGSNLRPYTYVFNSLVLGHHHVNMNFEGTTEQADMYLDSDVIIGMGVGKRSSRHAPSHNLLIGMDYFYETGGAPNPNYRPLIEGTFKDAKFQVNGTIVGGFEKIDDDLPYLERVTFGSVSLPKGIVYNASERSFTFDGTQASTSIELHNVHANSNKYIYLEISGSQHTAGTWGYRFYDIVDSGNGPTDNWVARQTFKTTSPTTFVLTTANNFKGTLHITLDYIDITARSINPNILLKDSKERNTFEIRTTQDPSILSMGLNSGKFLTHGGKTLILGNDTLSETPSATNNVFIGNSIFKRGLNITNNIILGNSIGQDNTKLSHSVVIGNSTLQSNFTNTVGRLTIVGQGAGKALTDGLYNCLFGEQAASYLTKGSNNLFLGSASGFIKEGSNNTFIGHLAGGTALTQSTVNNTIVIGANAAPEVINNTTTIATSANTDNFLYGTTHSHAFKVRGGLATQVMMADGTLKDESSFTSGSVTIPLATSTVVGGRKLFSDTVQNVAAAAVSATAARTYGVQVNNSGQMVVNVPWTAYTHPNSGVSAGTYKSVTVNAQGHVTAGTNPTTLAGYGITDAMSTSHAANAITSTNITNWNTAYTNNHTHSNKTFLDNIIASANVDINTSRLVVNPPTLATDTYASNGGFVQTAIAGLTNETPTDGVWFNKIKILHNNSAGYFTELAQSFTGDAGLWHRRMVGGIRESWAKILDANNGVTLNTAQTISGAKTFTQSIKAPAFYEDSLRSLKTNIQPFEKSGLDLIKELDIVTFDRKDETAKNKIGIIADDSPKEFLSEELDAVDLYKTVFIQAKAIQELKEEVNNLRELLIEKLK